jgi:hypothetical protein
MIYIQNIKNEGSVIHWYRMFKDGQINVHDEEPSGQTSVVRAFFFQSKRWYFTMSKLLCEFPQIYALLSTKLSQLG